MSRYEPDGASVGIGCFILTILLVLMFYIASPAHSQEAPKNCAPSADINDVLKQRYKEAVVAGGIVGPSTYLFVTANPKTQTFTIIVQRPDSLSCVVIGGTGFAIVDPPKKGTGL